MFKKILHWVCVAMIFFVVGLLFARMYTINNYPKAAEGVIRTETLASAYADGTLSGVKWEPAVPYDNNKSSNFFSHQPLYFAEQKTLIVTIRYNDSLLDKMNEQFGYTGDAESLPLSVSLYADGHEHIRPTTYTYLHANALYSYRRYVFEGVTLDDYEYLYLDVCYGDYAADGETPFTSLEIYSPRCTPVPYKLTAADKKTLG